jgi:hypothetical protein
MPLLQKVELAMALIMCLNVIWYVKYLNKTSDTVVLQQLMEDDEDDAAELDENAELIAKGKMKASVYLKYFRSGASSFILIFLALVLIIGQMASSGADFWVTYW